MQICALNSSATLVFADEANKHQNYQCIECHKTVRLRRGIHRKAHYYHLEPNRSCKQHAKGMPHIMLQYFLKNALPKGEGQLECQFGSIGRIADVAWHSKNIVYEIQCSPITAEEVRARNKSYASVGYQVVWILHDKRYNKQRLSAAEDFLFKQPHYFSDMNAEGEGKIYDQFSVIANGRRIRRFPTLTINPALPKNLRKNKRALSKQLPPILHQRAKTWPLIFSGDTIDSTLNSDEQTGNYADNQREMILYLRSLAQNKDRFFFNLIESRKLLFQKYVTQPYKAFLNLILEKACK